MHEDRNTKPTRRELLIGSTVAAVAGTAVCIVPQSELPRGDMAARLERWTGTCRAYMDTERTTCAVADKVDTERQRLPEPDPKPEDFASETTRAADAQLDTRAAELGRDTREISRRIIAEADANPAYREAVAAHEKALADWCEHCQTLDMQEAAISERHGLDRAQYARQEAERAHDAALRDLLAAPIASTADALAVATALLFAADEQAGLFDSLPGITRKDTLRRLTPWLPASPSAAWTF